MENTTIVIALPIGDLEGEQEKIEFEEILRVFDNLVVDLVIAAPISNEEEARQSIQRLSQRKPDLVLIVPLRGLSAQIIETVALASPALCLIWPIQGRFALPSSTLAFGALKQTGVPVELLYAPPDNPDTTNRIQSILRAARAFSSLSYGRIGIIGGLFPNLVSCRYDTDSIKSRLGTTLLSISFAEIQVSMEPRSQHVLDIKRFRQGIIHKYKIDADDLMTLDEGIRLHLALKRIALKYKLDGFATGCWTGFPDELGLNPCLGFVEDAYLLACEGDVMISLSQLIARSITGINPFVGDLFDVDMAGILTLVHCGAPASLALKNEDVLLVNSQRAVQKGFATLTCRPRLNPGLVTLIRFYGKDCDRMHIALGELLTSDLGLDLGVKIRLCGDRWEFLSQCFGNHYLVVPGDIRNELKLLCKWLNINLYET